MRAPIVAAYDPFTGDQAPVELALAAGAFSGAPVKVVSILPPYLAEHWELPEEESPVQPLIAASLERVSTDLAIEPPTVIGDASIPRALHELDAGLLVVGSTDRGRMGRVLPGSTAERLLHGARCPVALATRGYRRESLTRVAVGFTDTAEGYAALRAAHTIAARAGARLRVIAALHSSGLIDPASTRGMPPQPLAALDAKRRSELEATIADAVEALGSGAPVQTEIHAEDAADILLCVSENVDLIVCGSRGYGPLRSVLLGGVSRRVVDGAHCPVLVLPRGVEHPLADLMDARDAAAPA